MGIEPRIQNTFKNYFFLDHVRDIYVDVHKKYVRGPRTISFVSDMTPEGEISLLSGEKVEVVARPHPLSFLKYHLFAVYLVVVAVFLGWFYSYLDSNKSVLEVLVYLDIVLSTTGMRSVEIVLLVLYWVILLISGFVVSGLWVSKMPLIYVVLVAVAGTTLEVYPILPYGFVMAQSPMIKLILLGATAPVCMVLTELYRRGHVYILTNYRVITRKGIIGKKERDLTYDKITDVYFSQGMLGRMFNFGTVVPVTASGFGLGEDSAQFFTLASVSTKKGMLSGGVGGGRSVSMPRSATHCSLHGIRDPGKIRVIIGNRQMETKEASNP